MSINIAISNETSQIDNKTYIREDNKQNDVSTEIKNANQELKDCYNLLGQYSAPSMDNICNIWNSGNNSLGESLHREHMSYCDLYSQAALNFGNVCMNSKYSTVEDVKNAIDAVKTATQEAIEGLEELIQKEEAIIENDWENISDDDFEQDSDEDSKKVSDISYEEDMDTDLNYSLDDNSDI